MKEKCIWVVSSTRHSITVCWDTSARLSLETPQQPLEDKKYGSSLSITSSPKKFDDETLQANFEVGERILYILQMRDKILDWKIVYSGFKTYAEVKCLKPGECFQFRLKRQEGGDESDWSDCLCASTKGRGNDRTGIGTVHWTTLKEGYLRAEVVEFLDEIIPLGQLLRAVQNGNAITTKKIIAQRPSILNTPNKFSQSPLELAISNDDLNMVTLLVNNGADITRTEIGSWRTPLMIAAFRGHLDILKILREKGSSWDDRDRNGMTALHYAADNSHLEIVKFAIEDGADVTAKDVFGWSPLMRAVTLQASSEVIEYLLDNGGDANETDDRKQTLLMQAVQSGRPEIVRLILSKNAVIMPKNLYGHAAADFALSSSTKEIRKMAGILGREEENHKNQKKTREKPKEVKVGQRKKEAHFPRDRFLSVNASFQQATNHP